MSFINNTNFGLDVARGRVAGMMTVNKFGSSPNGVQTSATDIWSRADATPTQQIWIAPTTARIHAIVSTSANDTNTAGTGARTIQVYGLTSWSTKEESEVIALNGTGAVNTTKSYVIIHRMKVLTSGATSINVGTISATAATDGTVTAIISPGDGQTEMAIYGVPSVQDAYLTRWLCNIDKTGATTVTCDFEFRVNENPDVQRTNFLRKQDMSLMSSGTSCMEAVFDLPPKFSGPCIVKIQGIASAADTEADAA